MGGARKSAGNHPQEGTSSKVTFEEGSPKGVCGYLGASRLEPHWVGQGVVPNVL